MMTSSRIQPQTGRRVSRGDPSGRVLGFAESRAQCYFALSEGFKEPTPEFAADVCAGRLAGVLGSAFRELGLHLDLSGLRPEGETEEVWTTLKRSYYPLFVVPPDFVMPVESVFKEWGGENGFLAGAQDMFMGPPAVDMRRRYRARGLVLDVPRALKDFPDHLALLLEYGGLLCEAEDGAELQDFVREHFDDWIETFHDQVLERTRSPFYRSLTAALLAFVQHERTQANSSEAPTRPGVCS